MIRITTKKLKKYELISVRAEINSIREEIDKITAEQLNIEYHEKVWNESKITLILRSRFLNLFEGDAFLLVIGCVFDSNDIFKISPKALMLYQFLMVYCFSKEELHSLKEAVVDLIQWSKIILSQEKRGCKHCPNLLKFTNLLIITLVDVLYVLKKRDLK